MRLEDIVGQQEIISRLSKYVQYFTSRESTPGHVLLVGEEGMGKATVVRAFAETRNVRFHEVHASELQIQGDVTALLTNLREHQVLLINEVDTFRKETVAKLEAAINDFQCEIIIGIGAGAKRHVLEIKPFTAFLSCKRKSACPPELLKHCSMVLEMAPYSNQELSVLARIFVETAGATIDDDALNLIVKNCCRPSQLASSARRIVRAINKTHLHKTDIEETLDAQGLGLYRSGDKDKTSELQSLSGLEFELEIVGLLSRMGFNAETTVATGDGGIDIIATLDKPIVGGRYLFQCKRYQEGNQVSSPTIRDFYGAVVADGAIKGVLVTTSDFTVHAREFAERVGIDLINMQALKELFQEYPSH